MTDTLVIPLDDQNAVPITFTSGGEHVEPTPTMPLAKPHIKAPTPLPTPEGMAVVSAALADIVSRTEGPTPEPAAPPTTPSPTSAEMDVVSAALADQSCSYTFRIDSL